MEKRTSESTVLATCSIIELLAKLNQVLANQPQEDISITSENNRINEVIK